MLIHRDREILRYIQDDICFFLKGVDPRLVPNSRNLLDCLRLAYLREDDKYESTKITSSTYFYCRFCWQFRSHNHIFIEPSRPFTPFLKAHNNRFFGPSLCQVTVVTRTFDISCCTNNERCMFADISTNISSSKCFPIPRKYGIPSG